MDRETLLLLALGMVIAAALTVGVCGWVLFVRDRHLSRAVADTGVPHPEGHEER